MKALSDILTITPDTLVQEDSGPWLPFSQVQHLLNSSSSSTNDAPRLLIDDIPPNEYQLCETCPQWKGCDLTLLWDRKYEMWLTWDEYELLMKAEEVTVTKDEPPAEDPDVAIELLNKEVKRAKRKAYQERKKAKKFKSTHSIPRVYLSGIPKDLALSNIIDFCTGKNATPSHCQISSKTGDAWISYETTQEAIDAAAALNMKEISPGCRVSAQVDALPSEAVPTEAVPSEAVPVEVIAPDEDLRDDWDAFLDEQSSDDEFQIKTS